MFRNADCEKTQAPPDDMQAERHYAEKYYADQQRENRQSETPQHCMTDSEILVELFKYHPPTPETLPKYAAINQAAKNFAEIVLQNCPPCVDRSGAFNCIRMARMTANAAVALNGLSL